MLTAKKKISARDAVPKSSSADFYYAAQDWFKANTKLIGGAVLAIAALIVVGYLYMSGVAADDLAANRELRKVQELYQQQQYRLAIGGDASQGIMGLEEITDKYSGTPTAEVAMIYLGNSYLYAGDLDKALQVFEDASPDTDMLRAAALAGEAAVYEAKGEFAQAGPLFEKAARVFDNELLSTERFIAAGRAYGKAGDSERAAEMLDMAAESKNQQAQQTADRLRAQFGID
ncbi:MAG: tetratricopeptide repeat protein [Bacteroidota bacterium]|nr:tetratricopeptide repeat protein [Bacteroidota bacterium]